jgi:hypothetical protein
MPDAMGMRANAMGTIPEAMGIEADAIGTMPDAMGMGANAMGIKAKGSGCLPSEPRPLFFASQPRAVPPFSRRLSKNRHPETANSESRPLIS